MWGGDKYGDRGVAGMVRATEVAWVYGGGGGEVVWVAIVRYVTSEVAIGA